MVPGVGITPTYTISRAVLSDAVALVRGDRFYTVCSDSPPLEAATDETRLIIHQRILRIGVSRRVTTISQSIRDVFSTS
jgi:hypothetical protein